MVRGKNNPWLSSFVTITSGWFKNVFFSTYSTSPLTLSTTFTRTLRLPTISCTAQLVHLHKMYSPYPSLHIDTNAHIHVCVCVQRTIYASSEFHVPHAYIYISIFRPRKYNGENARNIPRERKRQLNQPLIRYVFLSRTHPRQPPSPS